MNRDAELLRALAPGDIVSGALLARRLGISRTAVWKRVRGLVALGVAVERIPGRGYRLTAPLDCLDEERIRAALPGACAARLDRIDVLPTVDSTSTRILSDPGPPGRLRACLAEYQTAGRGRRGRPWLAPPGAALCLSVGGVLNQPPAAFGGLPLALGVAAVRALERLAVEGVGLKWPNDLLWSGRKLGGVLIELRGEAEGPSLLSMGIGINHRLPAAARAAVTAAGGQPPTDLAEACGDRPPDRNLVATHLIDTLVSSVDTFLVLGLEPFTADWQRLDVLHGLEVRAHGAGQEIVGIARGVDRAGALLLERPGGSLVRITGGEISVRPVA